MDRTLTAVSAIVLLIGCCTGCGWGGKSAKQVIPKICFMYYESFEEQSAVGFCDNSGNYYSIISDGVKFLKLDELTERYAAGELDNDIKLVKICSRDEFEEAYSTMLKAVKSGNCDLKIPNELPTVEAPRRNWYGVYYDEDDTLATVKLHEEQCMTDINSGNEDLNDVYEWFSDTFQKRIK
jgi:hypothetical protein